MANQSIPTQFFDSNIATARATDTPFADFSTGANLAASNAGGIGINTGGYNPKPSDWLGLDSDRDEARSSYIGLDSGINNLITCWRDEGLNLNDNVAFGRNESGGPILPGETFDPELDLTNETGETLPIDAFAWAPQEITASAANGDILTDGIAIGVVPATFYNPVNFTLNRDWSTGTVEVSLNGVTDDGAYALTDEVITATNRPEAAQQIADAINLLSGVKATAFSSRVIIQPINTVATPDNKSGNITLVAYTVVQP